MVATADKLKAALSGLIVIVAGVLIALAGDATWAERKERLRERVLLTDLVAEFRENEFRLRADIAVNRGALAASEKWADEILVSSGVSGDSLATLYIAGNNFARFDPTTGALRSLKPFFGKPIKELGRILTRNKRTGRFRRGSDRACSTRPYSRYRSCSFRIGERSRSEHR